MGTFKSYSIEFFIYKKIIIAMHFELFLASEFHHLKLFKNKIRLEMNKI